MEKLIEIINEIREGKGDEPVKTISSEMSLREDLDFDSFDLAMLTAKIEDEFDAADLIEAAARFEKEPKTHSLDGLRKTYGL